MKADVSAAPTGALLRMTTARAVGTVLFGLILSPSTAVGEQAGLARFVRDAVAGNAAVLAAEAILLAESERRAGAERSYDNPELSIEAEDIGAFERGDHEMERRVVVGLTQQLDLHGKRRARTTAAAVRQQIAQAEVDGARAETAAELLHALAGWQTAAVRVTLLEAHEDAMEEFEALAGRQEAAGDISRMEAGLATLALAETRMRRVAAEVERSLAAQGVRNVTFAGEETTWPALDFALPPLGEVAVEDVSVLPIVRAASLRARAAAAEVDVSRLARRPDPTVSVGAGRERETGVVELGVSMPLPVLNRGVHAVTAATADATAAERESDDVTRRARSRFEASAERYRIARHAWQEWLGEGAGSLEDRETLARRSWEAGELTPGEYLMHTDAAVELKLQALDLRSAVWEAWFEWLVASGRLDHWLGTLSNEGGG